MGNNNTKLADVGGELFTGDARLYIESTGDYTLVNQLCEYLKTTGNLMVTSYSWSEKKGLELNLKLPEAIALGNVLRGLPLVTRVYRQKKKIIVELNEATPEPTVLTLALSGERIAL